MGEGGGEGRVAGGGGGVITLHLPGDVCIFFLLIFIICFFTSLTLGQRGGDIGLE